MKRFNCLTWLFAGLIYLAFPCFAAEEVADPGFVPTDAKHANWLFSGVISNENGDHYAYFFEMQRDGQQFHVQTALFDAQSKKPLLYEAADATLENPDNMDWQVGTAFLNYNRINNSWIFGLNDKNKKGFNFKVDLLSEKDSSVQEQTLRPGLELIIAQTSRLNGHIQVSEEPSEQFVTASYAWFRQAWTTTEQDKNHQFNGVFCRFNDGSGLYSIKLDGKDALQAALAGAYDDKGFPKIQSQFVDVKQSKDGLWHIKSKASDVKLSFEDAIPAESVVAGFVNDGAKKGFCMISKNTMTESKTVL